MAYGGILQPDKWYFYFTKLSPARLVFWWLTVNWSGRRRTVRGVSVAIKLCDSILAPNMSGIWICTVPQRHGLKVQTHGVFFDLITQIARWNENYSCNFSKRASLFSSVYVNSMSIQFSTSLVSPAIPQFFKSQLQLFSTGNEWGPNWCCFAAIRGLEILQ